MSYEYDNYLAEHKRYVGEAFRWIEANAPDLLGDLDKPIGWGYEMEDLHDRSKFSAEEYTAYDNYFYGNKSYQVVKDFDYAWLHHIHQNPHHWQYWILYEDEGGIKNPKPLEIPEEYLIEMICDWWSFSFKDGDLREIFTWYGKHKDKMLLHPNSRKRVEDILERIKEHLDAIDSFQNDGGDSVDEVNND